MMASIKGGRETQKRKFVSSCFRQTECIPASGCTATFATNLFRGHCVVIPRKQQLVCQNFGDVSVERKTAQSVTLAGAGSGGTDAPTMTGVVAFRPSASASRGASAYRITPC